MLIRYRLGDGSWSRLYKAIEFSGGRQTPQCTSEIPGLSWYAYWIEEVKIRTECCHYGREENIEGQLHCVGTDSARLLQCLDSEGTELKVGDIVAVSAKKCMRGTVIAIPQKAYTTGYTGMHLAAKIQFHDKEHNKGKPQTIKDAESILKIG